MSLYGKLTYSTYNYPYFLKERLEYVLPQFGRNCLAEKQKRYPFFLPDFKETQEIFWLSFFFRCPYRVLFKMALLDRPFHKCTASKSEDRRILFSSGTALNLQGCKSVGREAVMYIAPTNNWRLLTLLSPMNALFLRTVMLFSFKFRWSRFFSVRMARVGTSTKEFFDNTRCLRVCAWDDRDCGPRDLTPRKTKEMRQLIVKSEENFDCKHTFEVISSRDI